VEPAAENAAKTNDTASKSAKTYSDVFSEALIELAKIEPNLVAITPATAEGSGLVKFGKVYPDRFFDVAICEQHAVTMAAGMSRAGLKPVVSIYSTFLQRAMDQVIHDVSIMNLPVIFGIDRGGLVEDGETHQGVFDIAYMRSIPNFTVLAPKNALDLRNMLYTVLKNQSGPVAIRFPRDTAIDAELIHNDTFHEIDYASWEVVHQPEGRKQAEPRADQKPVAILATGAMVATAEQATSQLKDRGIDATIINAQSIKPLDSAMLESLIGNPQLTIVTVEEGCTAGGFGAAVLEWAAQFKVKNPGRQADIVCLGLPDKFIEHGGRNVLLQQVGLDATGVADFVASYCGHARD
jgi:Deoxyxylulose-5-phosphate synthase